MPTADEISTIRTLIPDDAMIYDNNTAYIFTDTQIGHFYTVAGGNLLAAAGYAMIAMGNSEAIISKVIRTQDLQTNGAAMANALRESGRLLIEQSQADEFYLDYIAGDGCLNAPELAPRWIWWQATDG